MILARAAGILMLASVLLSIIGHCAAERTWLLALLAVPAAVLGWWLTGVRALRPLPRILVNALMLAAIGWSAYRVMSTGAERAHTVTIFSEFLVALLLVKLWDRRLARDSAQVLTLSVFLGLGSVLNGNSLLVGAVLFLNVAVLTAAVMAFHVAAGIERAGASGAGEGRRAGLAFTTTAVAAFVTALAASIAVWLILPRGMGQGEWGAITEITGGRRTGFTDRVDLRRSGLISESQRVVMDARFEDTSEPGRSIGADGRLFYLRGAVLDEYQRGAWTSSDTDQGLPVGPVQKGKWVDLGPTLQPEILQHIVVRDTGHGPIPVMCVLDPASVAFDDQTSRLSFSRTTRTLTREGRAGRFSYSVKSDMPRMPDDSEPTLRAAAPAFPSVAVRQQAEAVLARGGLNADPALRPPAQDLTACREIEEYLRTNFSYTLDPTVGPSDADPVETFLLVTRSGHCEYFASAMVAMCRTVGIPARVIAGYVAGEYDPDQESYTIRECNAHAWVEAQTSPGIWLTFDPTPQDNLYGSTRPRATLLAGWTRWLDSLEDLWSQSVVSFDESSRRRILGDELNPPPRIQDWVYTLRARLRGRGAVGIAVFVLTAAAAAVAAVAALIALVVMARGLARRLGARLLRARAAGADPDSVRLRARSAFYRELLRALDRLGLPKPAWQSPLGHVETLREHHPALYAPARVAVAAYYRLRFGCYDLTPEEWRAAHAAVAAIRTAPRVRPGPK